MKAGSKDHTARNHTAAKIALIGNGRLLHVDILAGVWISSQGKPLAGRVERGKDATAAPTPAAVARPGAQAGCGRWPLRRRFHHCVCDTMVKRSAKVIPAESGEVTKPIRNSPGFSPADNMA